MHADFLLVAKVVKATVRRLTELRLVAQVAVACRFLRQDSERNFHRFTTKPDLIPDDELRSLAQSSRLFLRDISFFIFPRGYNYKPANGQRHLGDRDAIVDYSPSGPGPRAFLEKAQDRRSQSGRYPITGDRSRFGIRRLSQINPT